MATHHEIEFFAAERQAAYVLAVQIKSSAGRRKAALRLLNHPRREIQPGEMKLEREGFKERQGERPGADPAIQDAPAVMQITEIPGLHEPVNQIAVGLIVAEPAQDRTPMPRLPVINRRNFRAGWWQSFHRNSPGPEYCFE